MIVLNLVHIGYAASLVLNFGLLVTVSILRRQTKNQIEFRKYYDLLGKCHYQRRK